MSGVKYLFNTVNLIKISRKIYLANRETGLYQRNVRNLVSGITQRALALSGGTLAPKIFRKIQWYMVSTLFMGELLAELTGHQIDERYKKAFACLGAAGGLSDVLIDEYKYDKAKMMELLHQTAGDQIPAIDSVFHLYMQNLMELIDQDKRQLMSKYLEELFHWQAESLKQFDREISEEEVKAITMGKGGVSLLLCGVILPVDQERIYQPLFQLGGFIQLMNDTQDMFKDKNEGIQTYIRFKKSYRDIFTELESSRQKCFMMIKKLKYPPEKISYFLFSFFAMYIGILYKLKTYSLLTAGAIDLTGEIGKKPQHGSVNPFSLRSFFFCFPKILAYDFTRADRSYLVDF